MATPFSIFRDSTAAHAEPTFLQLIIGLTRHRYRRIPFNLSDRFHRQRRWDHKLVSGDRHEAPPSFKDIETRSEPSDTRYG
jgi:hypothetical protein